MWRSFFFIGALTGFVCGLALLLEPGPVQGVASHGRLVSIPESTYRMDGVITRNTCPTRPVPWPYLWVVAGDQLHIGEEKVRARFLRAATVFEAFRISRDGCAIATWTIKLMPMGAGIRGTASWEVRSLDAAGGACPISPGLPCMVEADITGLPEQAVMSGHPAR